MARGEEDPNPNPRDPKTRLSESSDPVGVGTNGGAGGNANIFSPRFKSAAAMAGWDEESLLMASLVVEDTPERQIKHKRRSDSNFKTPPTNSSRRKRRAPRRSPISIPVAVLNLDDDEEPEKDGGAKEKAEPPVVVLYEEKEKGGDVKINGSSSSVACSSSNLPCLDKLRDELSCAICLEICFEPTTTPCGHSFCKKCLRSAADKCGKKCPKCRQLISNSRSCTINTVLWNTIQLLFPQEVEARKAAGASSSREAEREIPKKASYNTRSVQSRRTSSGVGVPSSSSREMIMRRRRVILSQDEDDDAALAASFRIAEPEPEPRNAEQGGYPNHRNARPMRASSRDVNLRSSRRIPTQDEDAALALRMQREEFMEVFRGSHDQSSRSIALARANLRAMIARATAGHL